MIDQWWPYITVVTDAGHVRRGEGKTDWSSPKMVAFAWQGVNDDTGIVRVADEGVTWVRGWFNETSVEVMAMLSARVLGNAQPVDRDAAERILADLFSSHREVFGRNMYASGERAAIFEALTADELWLAYAAFQVNQRRGSDGSILKELRKRGLLG